MSKTPGRSHLIGNGAMIAFAMLAALGCYTISLKVSSERAAVGKLRSQVVADAHDIRMLQAELRTRSRLPELQRWNDSVLALSPPSAQQFVRDEVQLASYAPGSVRPTAPAQRPVAPAPAATAPAQPVPVPLLPVTPRAANPLAPGMKTINYAVPSVSRSRLGAAPVTPAIAETAASTAAPVAAAMPATVHAGLDAALVDSVTDAAASAPAHNAAGSPDGRKAPME